MKISHALLLLTLVVGFVQADGGVTYTDSSCPNSNDLLATITNLPACIVAGFFSFVISGLISTLQGFIDASFKFLFSVPNLTWFCSPFNAVLSVLESLFSLALMGVALLFITRAHDVEGRVEAKSWLENLLIMIVLLSFSYPLFQLTLDLNSYLSTSLANDSMKALFSPSTGLTSAIFALLILFLTALMLILTFVTLLLRYVLIPFLLLLFPVAIFLYFIPLTQSWGRAFLKVIFTLLFMTTLDALILLALSSLFNQSDPNLADSLVRAFAVLLGFGAIGIINVLLFLSAAFSVVSQSRAVSTVAGISLLKGVLKK